MRGQVLVVLPGGGDAAACYPLRRTELGFVREVYQGLDAVIPLAEIKADLPLAEIYEGIEFTPELEEDQPA